MSAILSSALSSALPYLDLMPSLQLTLKVLPMLPVYSVTLLPDPYIVEAQSTTENRQLALGV